MDKIKNFVTCVVLEGEKEVKKFSDLHLPVLEVVVVIELEALLRDRFLLDQLNLRASHLLLELNKNLINIFAH